MIHGMTAEIIVRQHAEETARRLDRRQLHNHLARDRQDGPVNRWRRYFRGR